MRLYLDEDTASIELVRRLRSAGHEVLEPLRGMADSHCWQHAQANRAAVLTTNARDFVVLAEARGHQGLLLVYRANNPAIDLKPADIAAAVDRVAETYPDGLEGRILTLNAFRW